MKQWWGQQHQLTQLVLIAVGVIAVLAAFGGLVGGKEPTTTTTEAVAQAPVWTQPTAETVVVTTDTTAAPTTTEAPTTTNAPQWVKVASLSGSTRKTGEVFELTGAPARLSYDVGDGYTVIYIMQDGTTLDKDGGFPEASPTEPSKDSTRLVKEPGRYYLVVDGRRYDVTIEEQH